METTANNTKIEDWKRKLRTLEDVDLPRAMGRIGEAASDGDWHENAEYEDAEVQVGVIQAKIDEIKVIIKKLEKEDQKKKGA